jgi:hypothetical protein
MCLRRTPKIRFRSEIKKRVNSEKGFCCSLTKPLPLRDVLSIRIYKSIFLMFRKGAYTGFFTLSYDHNLQVFENKIWGEWKWLTHSRTCKMAAVVFSCWIFGFSHSIFMLLRRWKQHIPPMYW